jgi:hypothetical protein
MVRHMIDGMPPSPDERQRSALTLIASFGGKTLIAPSFGP